MRVATRKNINITEYRPVSNRIARRPFHRVAGGLLDIAPVESYRHIAAATSTFIFFLF